MGGLPAWSGPLLRGLAPLPTPLRWLRVIVLPALLGGAVAGALAWAVEQLGTDAVLVLLAVLVGGCATAGARVAMALRAQSVSTSAALRRDATALHREVAVLRSDSQSLQDRLAALPDQDRVQAMVQASATGTVERLVGEVRRLGEDGKDDARQVEALLNLHAMIPVRAALPSSRGWAASPDLLLAYVGEIRRLRPKLIVECGSGLSTVWAALALQSIGGEGRVIALEHHAGYREATREGLDRHGVAGLAEVRLAPIEEVRLTPPTEGVRDARAGAEVETRPWYALRALEGLDGIGLLFVDGPVGALAEQARYPALPLLRGRLAPGAVVMIDDTDRVEETAVVGRWRAEWPELSCEMLDLEKGAAVLTVPG